MSTTGIDVMVCGRCGCAIDTFTHVCFAQIARLPIALCACGQPRYVTHYCRLLSPPQLCYPSLTQETTFGDTPP
jgi:hypothetical protein